MDEGGASDGDVNGEDPAGTREPAPPGTCPGDPPATRLPVRAH